MLAFALRMLRDKYKLFIVYAVASVGFLEMYIAIFPAIQKQSVQLEKLLNTMPSTLFKAMNMDPSVLSFRTLEQYLSSDYLSFLWPILAIVFAVSIANYILVTEIDKGTIETLASLPSTRNKIFIERYFTGLVMLALFSVISLFGAIPLAKLHNITYSLNHYVTATIGAFFFIWAVYSLATLFSVIFSEKGKATMTTGGVLIVMYVLNAIAALNNNIKDFKYFSFFHYFVGTDLLAKNIYPQYALLVLGGFAIIVSIVALVWVNRRDLSV